MNDFELILRIVLLILHLGCIVLGILLLYENIIASGLFILLLNSFFICLHVYRIWEAFFK